MLILSPLWLLKDLSRRSLGHYLPILLNLSALSQFLLWLPGLRLQHLQQLHLVWWFEVYCIGLIHIIDGRAVAAALPIDFENLLLLLQLGAWQQLSQALIGVASLHFVPQDLHSLLLQDHVAQAGLLAHVRPDSLCILSHGAAVNWSLEVWLRWQIYCLLNCFCDLIILIYHLLVLTIYCNTVDINFQDT